jgi:peptidoglycan/LPS O-acetylase OafA/YrhL
MSEETIDLKKHIPFLDGIRGLAIIFVLAYHCFPDIFLTKIGWIGVDLFFVLSGFLITGILVSSKEKPFYFKNFFIRRSLRIFPLYYLFLILMFFVIPFLKSDLLGDFSYNRDHQIFFWLYIQNWLFSLEGLPDNFSLNHLWSLGVEEQFYLFWPFIIYFTPQRKLIFVSVLLIFSSIGFRYFGHLLGFVFPYKYVHIFSRMDVLVMGALVFLMLKDYPKLIGKLALPVFILSFLVVVVYSVVNRALYSWNLEAVYSFIGLSFASFLAIACLNYKYSSLIRKCLDKNTLKWFGKYSYGIYIYHYPLYFIGLEFFIPILNKIGIVSNLAGIINGLTCILITCVISYFSFQYFEVKFLALKDRLTSKQNDRKQTYPV